MPGDCFDTVLTMGTQMSGGTIRTDFRIALVFPVAVTVGGAVIQNLVFRTDNAIVIFIIYVLPPFVTTLHGL